MVQLFVVHLFFGGFSPLPSIFFSGREWSPVAEEMAAAKKHATAFQQVKRGWSHYHTTTTKAKDLNVTVLKAKASREELHHNAMAKNGKEIEVKISRVEVKVKVYKAEPKDMLPVYFAKFPLQYVTLNYPPSPPSTTTLNP